MIFRRPDLTSPSFPKLAKEFYQTKRLKEDPYQKTFQGVKIDPYRISCIYGPMHPAQFQALKKILRAGKSHKPLVQDIEEAVESLERWLEMLQEDGK